MPCETAYLKIPDWKSTRFVPLNSWQDIAQQQTPLTFCFALTWPRWKEATTGEAQEIHQQQKPCLALKCAIESQNSATLFFPPVTSPPTRISSLIRRTFWGHSYTQQNYLPRMSPLPCQSSASETYWLTTQTWSPMVPSQTYCHSLTSVFLKARTNLINRIEEDPSGCKLEHF